MIPGVRYPGALADGWAPALRGPNGRRLCRGCLAEVPKGRQTWCGKECVDRHMLLSSGVALRRAVEERDGGRCTACRRKRDRTRERIRRVVRACPKRWGTLGRDCTCRGHRLLRLAAALRLPDDLCRSWWEADHIVPLSEGGVTALDNMRTLCVACHKRETAAGAKRRADARRRQAALPMAAP